MSSAQGGGGGLPGPLRLPDPDDLLSDESIDQLDFAGLLALARAFIEADGVQHAATLAVRATTSDSTKRRTAGALITALVQLARKKPKDALKSVKSVGESADPDIAAEVFLIRGTAMHTRRKWADAEANYRMAMMLRNGATSGLAAIQLGFLHGAGDEEEAAQNFVAATTCGDPVVIASAHLELAMLLDRNGRHDAAIDRYRAALSSPYPNVALHAAFNLAGLLRDNGDAQAAEESRDLLERIHATGHPAYAPKAAVELAAGRLEAGRTEGVVELLTMGTTSTDPAVSALAHLHLGACLVDPVQADQHLAIAEKTGSREIKRAASRARKLRHAGR
ncbi:tetratricopeptide repeat protein [Streptomyces hygroscopicus]|uniref:tetratricopeptide repeat protein n=1 Tax=Streptomyces hygroscopicus TaxID=1912 RepID=UPI00076771E0|nr:tetratricopeptide repeat protein [Streptomyces hygroscopicus]